MTSEQWEQLPAEEQHNRLMLHVAGKLDESDSMERAEAERFDIDMARLAKAEADRH